MNCLLQRVQHASVSVENQQLANIAAGLLVFVGIENHDDSAIVRKMTDKILAYRVFADEQQKMNRSLRDIDGDILLVSQFTLAANTQKGLRPSFSSAAHPDKSRPLFDEMVAYVQQQFKVPQTGLFGADMQVSLCNDGPVTFMLHL